MTTRSLPSRWLSEAGNGLWHWLRRPWLAIMAGLISVMLSIAVWTLPQLPGQLVDEQAAAATWLLNTSTAYGIWGNLFLALGLFDVLRSPLLYLLLALLLPTLAAQLADQLGALRQMRSAHAYALSTPSPIAGYAIPISSVRHLFRWRGMVNATLEVVVSELERKVRADFTVAGQAEAQITTAPIPLPIYSDLDSDHPDSATPDANPDVSETRPPVTESRILGTRFPRLQYIRPLLMIGLLVAVAGAWSALAFGWQVTAPPLAPGGTFRSANRNLVMHYTVTTTDTFQAQLDANLQGESIVIPADKATQARMGLASIQLRPIYPGIWITTLDNANHLTLPGESKERSSIGLVFADSGSEESILIPNVSSGLRIVQRAGTSGFVLELYRSDAIQPIYRAELTDGGHLTIPFGPGNTSLIVYALPGLQVDVRHLPGLWVVPLGILLAFFGAVAFLRPSTFVLAQVAPWTEEYAVIVLQSDHPAIIADLRAALEALAPPMSAANPANEETLPAPTT